MSCSAAALPPAGPGSHTLLLQVQNAKQTNSGMKHALEASLEEFRLPEVGRQDGGEAAAAWSTALPL